MRWWGPALIPGDYESRSAAPGTRSGSFGESAPPQRVSSGKMARRKEPPRAGSPCWTRHFRSMVITRTTAGA
jgi:hypothetical protein